MSFFQFREIINKNRFETRNFIGDNHTKVNNLCAVRQFVRFSRWKLLEFLFRVPSNFSQHLSIASAPRLGLTFQWLRKSSCEKWKTFSFQFSLVQSTFLLLFLLNVHRKVSFFHLDSSSETVDSVCKEHKAFSIARVLYFCACHTLLWRVENLFVEGRNGIKVERNQKRKKEIFLWVNFFHFGGVLLFARRQMKCEIEKLENSLSWVPSQKHTKKYDECIEKVKITFE